MKLSLHYHTQNNQFDTFVPFHFFRKFFPYQSTSIASVSMTIRNKIGSPWHLDWTQAPKMRQFTEFTKKSHTTMRVYQSFRTYKSLYGMCKSWSNQSNCTSVILHLPKLLQLIVISQKAKTPIQMSLHRYHGDLFCDIVICIVTSLNKNR